MRTCLHLAVLGVALLAAGCTATDAPPLVELDEVRYQRGDDPHWASSGLDDTGWPVARYGEVDADGGVLWMRGRVRIEPETVRDGRPTGIYIGGLASHELFWDGEPVGRGGTVGASAAIEIPGPIEAHYQVPDRLAMPGEHVVAVRTSAFHRQFEPARGYWAVLVGEYDRLAAGRRAEASLALGSLAGIAVTGLFALAMFWIDRGDRPFLLLALLCVSAGALLVAEQWRPLVGYSYDWHMLRLVMVTALTAVMCLQLLWLLTIRFPFANGRLAIAFGAAGALVAPFVPKAWDVKALLIFLFLFTLSLGWTAAAVRRRMPGAWLAFVGVAAGWLALVVEPYRFGDMTLYFAMNLLFVCLLCSHALEVRRERQERHEAQLKAARLEAEMLRKSIQPHFVLNALTAVSAWIEEDPATAVRLIDALADEFRLFTAMADLRFVPLSQELDLCRSHVATMSLRRGSRYELEVEDDASDPLVPPGVVHTLVENAITHGGPCASMAMRLSVRREGDSLALRFESPTAEGTVGRWSPGTGTRYVESRLWESYRNRCSFSQGPGDDASWWRAELTMPLEAAE